MLCVLPVQSKEWLEDWKKMERKYILNNRINHLLDDTFFYNGQLAFIIPKCKMWYTGCLNFLLTSAMFTSIASHCMTDGLVVSDRTQQKKTSQPHL